MLVGMPFRPWLSEPSGSIITNSRLSLLRLIAWTPEAGRFFPAFSPGFGW